jgi:hypothetical protein
MPTGTALPTRRALRRAPERGRRRTVAAVVGVVLGLVVSGLLVWRGTSAVFSSTTADGPNSFTLGSVTLSDDDTGSALFSAAGLVPGSTGSNCIAVSYTGTVATSVKLYAGASSDASGVAQYVDLTIEQGTGGGYGSCGGFGSPTTIYSGTLAGFTGTATDYPSGVGSWSPSGSATTVYRISYTLDAATPSGKQGTSTSATFQWESRA